MQVGCSGRVRLVRIIGKHVEEGASHDPLALRERGAQIGVARVHDGEVRVGLQDQKQAGEALEDALKIDACHFMP